MVRRPIGFDGVTLGIEAYGAGYRRYDGLSFAAIAANAAYKHKFGLGTDVPYASVGISTAYEDYRVDVRDSSRVALRAEMGKRFSASLDAGVGASYEHRHARSDVPVVPGVSGAIFELRGASAFARTAWAPTERLLVEARAAVRRGDAESTSQRNREIFLASDAIAADPAFEDPDLIGCRLRGTTRTLAATVSYAVGMQSAIGIGYLDERTHGAQGVDYRSNVVNASFSCRF